MAGGFHSTKPWLYIVALVASVTSKFPSALNESNDIVSFWLTTKLLIALLRASPSKIPLALRLCFFKFFVSIWKYFILYMSSWPKYYRHIQYMTHDSKNASVCWFNCVFLSYFYCACILFQMIFFFSCHFPTFCVVSSNKLFFCAIKCLLLWYSNSTICIFFCVSFFCCFFYPDSSIQIDFCVLML